MRIVLLSASYFPELTGIGPYSAELAEALSQRGHEVRVIASFPFYPDWIASVPPGTRLYRTEVVNRVQVTRCRAFVPSRPTPVRRLLHELSWLVSAVPVALASLGWAQVWFVVTPAFGSAVIGAGLARLTGARVHLHIQDLVPDVARESGHMGSGLFFHVACAMGRWTYSSFHSVSVLSEAMATGVRRYADSNALRIAVTPNWLRNRGASSAPLPDALRGRPYAVYAGSSGRKQDLRLLAQAADELAARGGPVIAVLGAGPGHEEVRGVSRHLAWLGLVDDETYAAIVGNALAGIVTLVPGVGDSVVPSKLASYLAAGRPVVAAAAPGSEAARVISEARCGFCVPPGRPDLLTAALCRIAADPREGAALGASGRAYALAHWDKTRVVGLLEAALSNLIAA